MAKKMMGVLLVVLMVAGVAFAEPTPTVGNSSLSGLQLKATVNEIAPTWKIWWGSDITTEAESIGEASKIKDGLNLTANGSQAFTFGYKSNLKTSASAYNTTYSISVEVTDFAASVPCSFSNSDSAEKNATVAGTYQTGVTGNGTAAAPNFIKAPEGTLTVYWTGDADLTAGTYTSDITVTYTTV